MELIAVHEQQTSVDQGRMWDGDWRNADDGSVIAIRYQRKYDPIAHVESHLGIYERYVDGKLHDTELQQGTTGHWEIDTVKRHLAAAGFVDVVVSAPFTDDTPPPGGWTATRCRKPR